MIGDFGVGKTSLIRRFVDRQFSDEYLSTVGVKISRKSIPLENTKHQEGVTAQLLIWDLEGHTKFKGIAPTYLQGASGVLIVADVSRSETVERISEHVKLFSSVNPKGSIIVALNKVDLIDEEKLALLVEISHAIGQDKVIAVYTTSAKTGKDVDEIFHKLAYTMVEAV
ncbi:MAG: GTP-binding protein [Oscillatoriales cyanobacterium]|nr:MAG: GTP-binding protein [Oscillatoriales cyanobacterium]TAE98043.1 MAG: GTP-binding protein [Oscillatoriales cyanobacterium]TAF16897.1 MAG: GTP-binding protein [Oscillatoriales cyanobacterium]TAF34882.1 MAG: GTP-binding protein [Oscillatoriales cyanobacterium]TAF54351.1 MAG: GTP-binding protein [Oscillatoriales cyanobacterium]